MAAARNNAKTLKLLLDAGVNPNAYEPSTKPPLYAMAARKSSIDAGGYMLEHGSNPLTDPRDGVFPLVLAILSGDRDMTNSFTKLERAMSAIFPLRRHSVILTRFQP